MSRAPAGVPTVRGRGDLLVGFSGRFGCWLAFSASFWEGKMGYNSRFSEEVIPLNDVLLMREE